MQRVWCSADPGLMQKYPEKLEVGFYPMMAWSHKRSWKRYKSGNSKTKNYLWNVHQQTHQTRLWLPREGLVHQTGAWLSDEGGFLRVGYLAAVFVGDNRTCPQENMVKGYFQRAQLTPQKLFAAMISVIFLHGIFLFQQKRTLCVCMWWTANVLERRKSSFQTCMLKHFMQREFIFSLN